MNVPPLRLLVVDDNPADHELMGEAVGEYDAGIELLLAATVAEAVRIAAAEPKPDLALVDLHLGRDSGRDLLRRLAIPAAILSTADDPRERELALAAGAIAFWIKPLHFDGYRELLAQVRRFAATTG